MPAAAIETSEREGRLHVRLSGDWTLTALQSPIAGLEARLQALAARNCGWELSAIGRLDSVGAILIWRAWSRRWPEFLGVSALQRAVL